MCLTFTTVLACRTGDDGLLNVLKNRWWKYLIVSILDVEANYLVVKAYQYTTLTSIQLLDCFTIPVVLLLSWVVMRVRFKIIHIVGVSVSLMGIGCLVWADADSSKEVDKGVESRLTGDMVCMAGAFFYGVTNVAEEHFIKKYDQIEFLGMLGLFGTVISGFQLALTEHPQVSSMNWHHWEEIGLVVAYSAALYAFYATVPLVLSSLGSTAFNLSLLSTDYYSLIAGVALFRYKYHALYAMSFVFFISGTIIFCSKKTSRHNDGHPLRGTCRSDDTSTLSRTPTVTTAATARSSSGDFELTSPLVPFPPPPPPASSKPPCIPLYNNATEMAYGTYRRQKPAMKSSLSSSRMDCWEEGDDLPAHEPDCRVNQMSTSVSAPAFEGRPQSAFSTMPRHKVHKEVTFNPKAILQVYSRQSPTYDGDEQL
ncbi:solute carrier family 35 member F2-like isoform X2 [Artemia franciscana]